jgi:hypothetical protein
MTTEIQRMGGVGINAHYIVTRAGKRVATISRRGRSDWTVNSVHYGERLSVHRDINAARAAAMARTTYPDVEKVYEIICRRIEQQRRHYMQQQRAGDLHNTALDLAIGEDGAADRIVLISRMIEAFAKDRLDTEERERQRMETCPGDFRHGVPLYPSPPGERK